MSAPTMVLPIVQQVASALGKTEDFAELLACIPDSFFSQGMEAQQSGWKMILALVVRGERDFEKIASKAGGER